MSPHPWKLWLPGVAWGLEREGRAKEIGPSFSPFIPYFGENVFKIYQKAVINKQIPKSRDLSPAGRADWAHDDQTVGAG